MSLAQTLMYCLDMKTKKFLSLFAILLFLPPVAQASYFCSDMGEINLSSAPSYQMKDAVFEKAGLFKSGFGKYVGDVYSNKNVTYVVTRDALGRLLKIEKTISKPIGLKAGKLSIRGGLEEFPTKLLMGIKITKFEVDEFLEPVNEKVEEREFDTGTLSFINKEDGYLYSVQLSKKGELGDQEAKAVAWFPREDGIRAVTSFGGNAKETWEPKSFIDIPHTYKDVNDAYKVTNENAPGDYAIYHPKKGLVYSFIKLGDGTTQETYFSGYKPDI